MQLKNILKLIGCIILCELAGIIGSAFTVSSIPTWYAALTKPGFNPPNWIFGPVWTLLFLLMGISLYFVISKGIGYKKVKIGIAVFCFQLLLNVLWSFLFFGLRSPFFAFIEIIVLWLAIALTIYQFWGIDKKAAYLMVPYILWVSFAAFLNYSIWMLNA